MHYKTKKQAKEKENSNNMDQQQLHEKGRKSLHHHEHSLTKKKVVTFDHKVKMKLTRHLNDYRDSEYQACFYEPNEYEQFRQDAFDTARMIEEMKLHILEDASLDNLWCGRGVECCTHLGVKTRKANRKKARMAVLDEQRNQRTTNDVGTKITTTSGRRGKKISTYFYDDAKIASEYSKNTRSSAILAHLTGLSDQHALKIDQQQDDEQNQQRQRTKSADHEVTNRNHHTEWELIPSSKSRWSSSKNDDSLRMPSCGSLRNRNSLPELLKYKLDFVDRPMVLFESFSDPGIPTTSICTRKDRSASATRIAQAIDIAIDSEDET